MKKPLKSAPDIGKASQKKLGRPALGVAMVHTGVVLPKDLLERLKADGMTSGRGSSGEIRHRLQVSYDQEASDSETRHLIECTRELASSITRDLGIPWHRTSFGRAAFKAGLLLIAAGYDVAVENASDMPWTGYPDDAPPEVVGQTHARLILAARRSAKDK
jgi:hypothetical protein